MVKYVYPFKHEIFWAKPGVGIVLYINKKDAWVYRLTTDGGENWGEEKIILGALNLEGGIRP